MAKANLGKAGSMAATGALVGSSFGPIGTGVGAAIGGLGSLASDWLSGDDVAEAEAKKQAAMQKGADQYMAYRPTSHDMREQGLRQQLSAYNGANQAMNLMYGTQYDPRHYAPNLGNVPDIPNQYTAGPSKPVDPGQWTGTPQQVQDSSAGSTSTGETPRGQVLNAQGHYVNDPHAGMQYDSTTGTWVKPVQFDGSMG